MSIHKFGFADAFLEPSPGQDEIFTGNVIHQRHGAPITIGFGRYGPDQTLIETIAVDDVTVVLQGRLTVSAGPNLVSAGPGEIVYMPKGEAVTIRSHEQGPSPPMSPILTGRMQAHRRTLRCSHHLLRYPESDILAPTSISTCA